MFPLRLPAVQIKARLHHLPPLDLDSARKKFLKKEFFPSLYPPLMSALWNEPKTYEGLLAHIVIVHGQERELFKGVPAFDFELFRVLGRTELLELLIPFFEHFAQESGNPRQYRMNAERTLRVIEGIRNRKTSFTFTPLEQKELDEFARLATKEGHYPTIGTVYEPFFDKYVLKKTRFQFADATFFLTAETPDDHIQDYPPFDY